MRKQVETFATSLLDYARTSQELEIMLNYNPTGEPWIVGEKQTLERLKLAIKYKQKNVCLHKNTYNVQLYMIDLILVHRSSERSTIVSSYMV